MAVKIIEVEQGSELWHKLRSTSVTGSNANILLRYGAAEAIARNNRPSSGGYDAERGLALEGEALNQYEDLTQVKPQCVGFMVNDKYENAGCSPDAITADTLLEVKCFGEKHHMAIIETGKIDHKIMCQLQFNMMISGLPKAQLILYNPDLEYEIALMILDVEADVEMQERMAERLAEYELQPS